jgi:hypothetical protein
MAVHEKGDRMKREEIEQIAKMAGALLVYNPHGGPIMADNLDLIKYTAYLEGCLRLDIISEIMELGEHASLEDILVHISRGKT